MEMMRDPSVVPPKPKGAITQAASCTKLLLHTVSCINQSVSPVRSRLTVGTNGRFMAERPGPAGEALLGSALSVPKAYSRFRFPVCTVKDLD